MAFTISVYMKLYMFSQTFYLFPSSHLINTSNFMKAYVFTFVFIWIHLFEMTLKGGTSQACASCKYQRRRCTSTCQLAPYFPADQPKVFQNAHRLFGVRNMLKILERIESNQKCSAMKSIIYEANAREKYPVCGCFGIIQHLCQQIQTCQEEVKSVYAQLAVYKDQQQLGGLSTLHDFFSELQLGTVALGINSQGLFHQEQSVALPTLGSNQSSYSDNANMFYDPKENNNSVWLQQSYNDNYNPLMMHSQFVSSQPLCIQQKGSEYFDEIHHFNKTIDDKQSYIDSREVYDSSWESSVKDTILPVEHVGENELKSAAACFSLTSVN